MNIDGAKNVHEGKNVKRIREILGIKQETLANSLGLTQQAVSQLEQREALDKEVIEKVAAALKVTPEAIKNFNEENTVNIFSNTYNDNASSIYNNFNSLEKYIQQVEKNEKLYQALLKSEQEKNALLERLLNNK